ncbi:ABC transporter permease [Celeribacter baekdonensis]|uniref:ABC transporter permease n=1 Tax=Celeribacter baekdonensis TaxID=875171 RepID=A0A2R4M5C3_9RHOB|nr:ABC transporter permease [Celeribacter baekdonensis]AVW92391.1 ABC transporter permease [Celeribacter baekdonensis]|tara:strand:- start:12225 stop:13190 length:966 start_codon:yes stop_codon:yes gene_type:complete
MSDIAAELSSPAKGARRRLSRAEAEHEKTDHRRRWLLSAPALIIVTLLSLVPLGVVLAFSLLEKDTYGGVVWHFSGAAWLEVIAQRDIFDGTLSLADAHLSIFWRSIKLSLITTTLTLMVGVPIAYFIATRPRRIRNLWLFLITIPFWTSLLIRTIAIMEIIRKDGIINATLMKIGIIHEPVQILFTDFAIGMGMTYVYLPLMVLPVYASVERLDFNLLEACYDLYATRWTAFRRVVLPMIKPGVIAGAILVFVPSLGDYVTPRILGGGGNLMIGNLIELQFGQGRNWPLGAALSLTLMLMIIGILFYYVAVTGKEETSHE